MLGDDVISMNVEKHLDYFHRRRKMIEWKFQLKGSKIDSRISSYRSNTQ